MRKSVEGTFGLVLLVLLIAWALVIALMLSLITHRSFIGSIGYGIAIVVIECIVTVLLSKCLKS